ncbi:helix-turn-helix transcriptional regulator [Dyella sp.]|jgi:AraC-like DNA-binding protein|uniref:AraC family transcriptional regulator n=1 Tax=Dyella sp. TaxID=1869338 RepID=UPI002C8C60FE|nr:helix-turn-helix transcriptional regulator [Dyella sp.]HTC27996.1 helix-turn-helix transcriptional regulator [Dyella sp.]
MSQSDEEFHKFIERADGQPVIAYWDEGEATSEFSQKTHKLDWHSHIRGQLWCVESGLVHVHTERGSWLLPPHRAGWMPPGEMHTVTLSGVMSGWGVFMTPEISHCMPDHPAVIGVSSLMRELVHRASSWPWDAELDEQQERIIAVLVDEVRSATREPLHLPMPVDRRLLRIAHAVMENPQDNRSLEEWASWAGLSPRTLSRLFRAETALSFAQWRQQARLTRCLEQLADGTPVAAVADGLGYASTSAFIAMFRRSFGDSPARYFGQRAVS